MPADPWDLTVWPSPTPETEMHARVRTRTHVLGRRRILPVVGAALLVVAGLSGRPAADNPLRITSSPAAEPSPSDEDAPPSTTTTTAAAGLPKSIHVAPSGTPVDEEIVLPSRPTYPQSPRHTSKHPVVVDPSGDAWVMTEATGRGDPDPTLDITHVDVKADRRGVTVELALHDLAAQPPKSYWNGKRTATTYRVVLLLPDGRIDFTFTRPVGDHEPSTDVMYRSDEGTGMGTTVGGSTGAIDVARGVVRMATTFDAVNRARAHVMPSAAPIGPGTEVRVTGNTLAHYATNVNMASGWDDAQSNDPDVVYRLGD